MRQHVGIIAVLGFALVLLGQTITNSGEACARIFWNTYPGVKVAARTFDWVESYNETLWVFPRGTTRVGGTKANPARWAANYGSVAVVEHKHGLAVATDGVNEAGLGAHLLYLKETGYQPRNVKRPGVSIFLWIQYYLDNFKDVNEVIDNISRVQIVSTSFGEFKELPLHVAIEDASGDSAIIEFIGGKLTVHHGDAYGVMTNDPPYDQQLENLTRYSGFGGTEKNLPGGIQPLDRFVRAAYFLAHLPKPKDSVVAAAYVMGIAENVSVPFGAPYSGVSGTYPTWWRTVIDYESKLYYFDSTLSPNRFWMDYGTLNFEPGPARRLDALNPALFGNVNTKFTAAKFR